MSGKEIYFVIYTEIAENVVNYNSSEDDNEDYEEEEENNSDNSSKSDSTIECDCDKKNMKDDSIFKCDKCGNKFCEKCIVKCDSDECISGDIGCPICSFLTDLDLCYKCLHRKIDNGNIVYCKTCKEFCYVDDNEHNNHKICENIDYNTKMAKRLCEL